MAFEGWFLSYYLQLAVRIVIGMNSEASGWQLNRPIVPIWIIHWTKYKMFDCEPHRIGKYFFFVSVSKCACVMRVKCSNQTNHDKNIKKETKKKKKIEFRTVMASQLLNRRIWISNSNFQSSFLIGAEKVSIDSIQLSSTLFFNSY